MKDKEEDTNITPPGEDYQIRCPRLGHQIHFHYCRFENKGLPCFKTLDCWYTHFNVEDFLRLELEPKDWEKAFSPSSTAPNIYIMHATACKTLI